MLQNCFYHISMVQILRAQIDKNFLFNCLNTVNIPEKK